MMEAVPWIRSGVGSTPAGGGCIMQIVDWLDREGWTDQPECVHPVFRKLAIYANDKLPDGERQKLLDLTGRLMGTNTGGKEMSVGLAAFVARRVLHTYEKKRPGDDRPRRAIEAAERWADDPSEDNKRAAYAAYAAANAAAYAADAAAYAAYAADAAAYAAYAADAAAYAAANDAAYATNAAANAVAAEDAAYRLLVDTLDEYDRLSGRTETCRVDFGPVVEMLASVGGGGQP